MDCDCKKLIEHEKDKHYGYILQCAEYQEYKDVQIVGGVTFNAEGYTQNLAYLEISIMLSDAGKRYSKELFYFSRNKVHRQNWYDSNNAADIICSHGNLYLTKEQLEDFGILCCGSTPIAGIKYLNNLGFVNVPTTKDEDDEFM